MTETHPYNIFWGTIAPDGWIPEEHLAHLKKDVRLSARDRLNGWRVIRVVLTELPEDP